jgi:hypothetical protein
MIVGVERERMLGTSIGSCMTYDTAYDIAQAGYVDWWFVASGFLFVAIGAALCTRWHRAPTGWKPTTWRAFAGFYLAFAIFWTTTAFVGTYRRHASLCNALAIGAVDVVEGRVEDFDSTPDSHHKSERFRVGRVRFEYSDYILNGGFHQTRRHGGPMKAGLYVRIWYVGSTIVRLEILRENAAK